MFGVATPIAFWQVASVSLLLYVVGRAIYNIYFHPLSHIPGPKLYAASQIPREFESISGRLHYTQQALHNKYGDAVRIGPNEVSFTSAQALKDIFTRHGREGAFPKDHVAYNRPANGIHSMLTVVDDTTHSRYRRLFNHSFSEKALQEQSPLLRKYVDLLMTRLRASADDGAQDMVGWFNWTAFDVIGDLLMGESFGCLEESKYHPWVSFLFSNFKAATFMSTARHFPPFDKILLRLIPKELLKARTDHMAATAAKVRRRMTMGSERGDLMDSVLKHNDKETGMTEDEIIANIGIILVAGSETSATTLSAAVYYLLKNPATMKKLQQEISTTFKSEDEITYLSVNQLKYQSAVLDETLRVHPPTPNGWPRLVPEGGRIIGGRWVAAGTSVIVPIYTLSRQEDKWAEPTSFVPERWIDNDLFPDDDRNSFAPFSLGPRNCIGRNLAYAEMRLVLARLTWNFDLELDERSRNWVDDMKMYILWEKPSLYVHLKPVVRD